MKKLLRLLVAVIFSLSFTGYKTTGTNEVKIGSQIWMGSNLDVSHFRNGDPIPEAESAAQWIKASKNKLPVWTYQKVSTNGSKYGKLYNWYAVIDPRGLAPNGWHIPNDNEWSIMSNYLGGMLNIGNKLKSIFGWASDNTEKNASGFNAYPAGSCTNEGELVGLGSGGSWWSSEESDAENGLKYILSNNNNFLLFFNAEKGEGHSIRCVKDEAHQSVAIGNQIWMAKNLDVTTFRNGDRIPLAKTAEEWKVFYKAKQPAWCYYENFRFNGYVYGKLYNWFAVSDARGLAPVGWHIPGELEWATLADNLGGEEVAGSKIKSTEGWSNFEEGILCRNCNEWSEKYRNFHTCSYCNNTLSVDKKVKSGNGTNSSGFNGLPGGGRNVDGVFLHLSEMGYYWSIVEESTTNKALRRLIYNRDGYLYSAFSDKGCGFSVRCLKD